MSARYLTRQTGDVTIVDIEGRITRGEGANGLRDQIAALVKQGQKKVILNLAETRYVDSYGVAGLVDGFSRLTNCGAKLKLLSPSKRIRDLLRITKYETVFEVFDDEAVAVRSFGGCPPSIRLGGMSSKMDDT